MVVHEMTAQECRAMFARTNVARLACARNNQPYIVPIHVDLDREFLYGFATQGQKIDWMRHNPLVCVEIDEFSPQHWASVVAFGHYEELPHQPEYEDSRSVALQLFERHPMWWQPATVPLAGHEQRAPVAFRIRIDRLTGRRGVNGAGTAHEQEPVGRKPAGLAGSPCACCVASRLGPTCGR
jgi:nitroimidazol reductase NimA-like FMN-containing flavoprotein (pyridoxamine 5'-phosphate oxidase superfamily)